MELLPGFHVLGKSTVAPPDWAKGAYFKDAFGNTFQLVYHLTPSAGVAVDALGPVGYVDGAVDRFQVTADVSQSDATKVAGASMVALTIAETAAGVWHFVLKQGSAKEYMSGGRGVPLGDPAPSNPFVYTSPYTPVDHYPTDGNIADGSGLCWGADNTWTPAADDAVEAIAGRALAADSTNDLDAADAYMDCPMGYTFVDTGS